MTDGIIQKIINRKIHSAIDARIIAQKMNDNTNVQNYNYLIKNYKQIEQELIKEIKKIRQERISDTSNIQNTILNFYERQLIGDNQE